MMRVHTSVSVFNIDAKEVTESVPVPVSGVGTISADSKGNAELKVTSTTPLGQTSRIEMLSE